MYYYIWTKSDKLPWVMSLVSASFRAEDYLTIWDVCIAASYLYINAAFNHLLAWPSGAISDWMVCLRRHVDWISWGANHQPCDQWMGHCTSLTKYRHQEEECVSGSVATIRTLRSESWVMRCHESAMLNQWNLSIVKFYVVPRFNTDRWWWFFWICCGNKQVCAASCCHLLWIEKNTGR